MLMGLARRLMMGGERGVNLVESGVRCTGMEWNINGSRRKERGIYYK